MIGGGPLRTTMIALAACACSSTPEVTNLASDDAGTSSDVRLSGCAQVSELCETDVDCCSFKCTPDNDGLERCQTIDGCLTSGPTRSREGEVNIYGEPCDANDACCSGRCTADGDGVDRCAKLGDPECDGVEQVCLAPGELCETECQCCAGRCDRPRAPDARGYAYPKRCLSNSTCLQAGEACVDPGECCDGRCVRSEQGGYRCAAE